MKDKIAHAWKQIKEDFKRCYFVLFIIAAYFVIMSRLFYSACPVVMLTGLPCPGCGLSRAGFSILKGYFALAWQLHPFIYFLIFIFILWFLNRYFCAEKYKKVVIALCILWVVGSLAFYAYRMWKYFPNVTPMLYYKDNWLQKMRNVIN